MFRLWVNTCWEEYTCLCLKTTVAVFGCHFCTNEKWLPWSAPWTGPGDGVCVCTFQKLDPSWTMPCVCLYALWDHTRFTEHTEKLGSLIQCPKTFVFLHTLPHCVLCRLCHRPLHIVRKNELQWKQTSHYLWKQVHANLPTWKTLFWPFLQFFSRCFSSNPSKVDKGSM